MTLYDLATSIVQKINLAGHIAYFAGGWVRDHVLGIPSCDIDLATSASPDEIAKIFPKNISVGAAFGVIVVLYKGHSFEVSTFRQDDSYVDGRRPKSVKWSSAQEDALRRDFTINGLFFDPITEQILDFVNGQKDIQKGIIRAIGDPKARFLEDRLRMMRAIRFSHRLGFTIEQNTKEAISSLSHLLVPATSVERIWQELQKMTQTLHFEKALLQLEELGLLQTIFPAIHHFTKQDLLDCTFCYKYFPSNCSTILYLIPLFFFLGYQKKEIFIHLKIANKELQKVDLFDQVYKLSINSYTTLSDWIKFYAKEDAKEVLHCFCAFFYQDQSNIKIQEHQQKMKQFATAIERVQKKQFLVNATLLQNEGILPGKQMGELLFLAENIALNHQLEDATQIMQKLKQEPLWQKIEMKNER